MRARQASLLVMAAIALSGCVACTAGKQAPITWKTGFWFWRGSSAKQPWSTEPVDLLFVQVGNIRKDSDPPYSLRSATGERWFVYSELPKDLPPAQKYWFVLRCETPAVPPSAVASMIATEVARPLFAARKRGLPVAGLQLDIDSPTAALPQYAAFLREVRKALPDDLEISITALLDWFRPGTAIADVIAAIDEFVPQFYDLEDPRSYGAGTAIAARIDAPRWAPVFNRFQKRFRVGISTFGRARSIRHEPSASGVALRLSNHGNLAPIDIATNPAFQMKSGRNAAGELILSYSAMRKIRIGYTEFEPGDMIQFTLATPESVRAAVTAVRQMQGYLAGVVFFRWPSFDESLAMQPEEALQAAGMSRKEIGPRNLVRALDGGCAAVACVDVYLESAEPFSPKEVRYRIRSTMDLEYFLPEKNMPIRMTGPAEVTLALPPYCGRGRLYLGRAVTATRSEYTVKAEQ